MPTKNSYMKGTEGKPDYMIVAKQDGLRLGIKGVLEPGPAGCLMLSMRIRSQPISKPTVKKVEAYTNVWPLNFTKVSPERASCQLSQLVNQSMLSFEKVFNAASKARFASNAFDYLENIGVTLECSREQFVAHLEKQWFGGPAKHVNKDDPKFLLSTWVDLNQFMKNAPKGLTLELSGLKMKGKPVVWPEVKSDLDTLLNGGSGKELGSGPATGKTGPAKPTKNKKTPSKKSPE